MLGAVEMRTLTEWYRARLRQSRLGTILATGHFMIVSAVIAGISVLPSGDWPWWTLVPFVLDIPFSFVIQFLCDGLLRLVLSIPHTAFESLLLRQREPFSSLDLFWLPAFLYVFLGTVWHYYWPQAPRVLRSFAGRKRSIGVAEDL
jgi:hypothetical protein